MLDPDDFAKDVKSMDSRLETLVSELKKANIQAAHFSLGIARGLMNPTNHLLLTLPL